MAYTKPQQRKKEESERQRGKGDQIKFTDLRFESWQVVRLRKARRRQQNQGVTTERPGRGGHRCRVTSIIPKAAATTRETGTWQ